MNSFSERASYLAVAKAGDQRAQAKSVISSTQKKTPSPAAAKAVQSRAESPCDTPIAL
jgi:hypothetical protein